MPSEVLSLTMRVTSHELFDLLWETLADVLRRRAQVKLGQQ
jgi:hypothetical protein